MMDGVECVGGFTTGGTRTLLVGELGADTLITGVAPTDTPTSCVFDEDPPDGGVSSTDTLTGGVLDEDAFGVETLTTGEFPTVTLIRGAVVCAGALVRSEDAGGERDDSSARAPAATDAVYRPMSNATTQAPLSRIAELKARSITHEPWRD